MKNNRLFLQLFFCSFLLLQLSFVGFAQEVMQKDLNKFCLDEKNFFYTNVAVSVRDIESNQVLAEVNANRSMTPASIVKLYTSAAALAYLGDDFKFKTTVGYTGYIDKNGTLFGDVVVIGGGDPTMGSKYFPSTKNLIDTIVKSVLDAGISKIKGSVVIDCSLYKDEKETIPKTWLFDDYGKDYAAGVFPVAFQDNIFQVNIKTGTKGEIAQLSDTANAEQLSIQEGVAGDSTLLLHSNANDQLVKINGFIPPNRNEYIVRSAMPSPPDVLGMELHQAFFKKGLVPYNHEYKISKKSVHVKALKDIYSPELQYIVAIMNYNSNNNYAEHLVKYLASQKGLGTFNEGALLVLDYFKKLDVQAGGVALYDGSGLSRTNITNANHMSEFLVKEFQSVGGVNSSFYKSLPISGRSGTLRSFPFTGILVNKINAKTGSMSGVRNMAGYMNTKSGKKVSFCIMFNGFFETDYSMKEKQTQILEMIYNNY